MKFYNSICIVVALICLNGFAQKPAITFENYNINDGLSQSTVKRIFQDKLGLMWFGTYEGGLNSFDGYDFTQYKQNSRDTNSLSGSEIYSINENHKGNLLIVTNKGLNVFNRETNSFKQYSNELNPILKQTKANINLAIEGYPGIYWLGTSNGLIRFDVKTKGIAHYLTSTEIDALLFDSDSVLWIGTKTGLFTLNKESRKTGQIQNNIVPKAPAELGQISDIIEDSDNNIWVTTLDKGLFVLLNKEPGNYINYAHNPLNPQSISSNYLRCIIEDKPGCYWIGTGTGLNYFDRQNTTFYKYYKNENNDNSLSQNSIYDLVKDNNGVIWVGTWNGGVCRLKPSDEIFTHYKHERGIPESLSNNLVSCFSKYGDNIWIGTEKGGLNLFNRKTETFTSYQNNPNDPHSIHSNHILVIEKDAANNLWLGTANKGLIYFNIKTNTFTNFLKGEHVTFMIQEDNGNYLVGSRTGVYLFSSGNGTIQKQILQSENNNCSYNLLSLAIKINDEILLLTESGLYRYNKNSHDFTPYGTWDDSISTEKYRLHCIYTDSEDNIWIGNENGLYKFNETRKQIELCNSINREFGSVMVKGILEDDFGNLWLSSNSGLYSYNTKTEIIKQYIKNDGLQSNEFIKHSCLKFCAHEMYFGGINGFNVLNPSELSSKTTPYKIVFTDFLVFNNPVDITAKDAPLNKHISTASKIQLNHNQNFFTLKFAALNFAKNKKSEYAYMLKDYDKDWNRVGFKRDATYTNIKHGTYTFMVKCTNNAGEWSDLISQITIKIYPPFWKTIWFRVAAVFAVLLLIGVVFKLRVLRIEHQNKLLETEVHKQTKELIEQKAELEQMSMKIHEADQAKLKFFTNISHEFRTPLTLILGPLESLLSRKNGSLSNDIREMLNMMQRNSIRLMHLINRIIDFRKIEQGKMTLNLEQHDIVSFIKELKDAFNTLAKQQNINYSFRSMPSKQIMLFDAPKLEMIIYNLLSNAFKFTPQNGEIALSINHCSMEVNNEPGIKIKVRDSGCGIASNQLANIFDRFTQAGSPESHKYFGSGIGLAITKELIELHKGKITVNSDINKGSIFTIYLPLRELHKSIREKQNLDIQNNIGLSEFNEQQLNILQERLQEKSKNRSLSIIELPRKKNSAATILVVDDNPDIRRFLIQNLEQSYQLYDAENGRLGLELAEKINPDLIISDLVMPEMNGLDFCSNIKTNINTSHIPVILLTAYASVPQQLEGFKTGADYYIAKPFSIEILTTRIKNLLASREVIRKKFSSTINLAPTEIATTSTDELFLKKTIEIIDANISNPDFTVDDLSSKVGMSSVHLYRKLHSLTNLSPGEFIRKIKLTRASILLSKTDMRIQEVMYDTGFENRSTFNTNFKKLFGKTPTEYAKDNVAESN